MSFEPQRLSVEEAIDLLPDWPRIKAVFEQRPNTGNSYPTLAMRDEVVQMIRNAPSVWRSGETGIRLRLGIYIQCVHPEHGLGQLFIATVEPGAPEPLMTQYAIYAHPLDYPEGFVVREWWIMENEPEPLPGGCVACDSLDEARALVPEGMACIARAPDDDPTLVEAWV